MSIIIAAHENMDAVREYGDQVLARMGFDGALVTDQTRLADFSPPSNILRQVSDLVGFPVEQEAYLVDICVRWRNRVDISIA